MEPKSATYPPLTPSYPDNVALLDGIFRVEENFDLIKSPSR